jgi:putative ABC transport system permease protein
MKLLDILTTASSNMFRSKLRTSLTIVAIFIGAFTLTLTNGLGAGINKYIDKELGNYGAADALIITPHSENSGPSPSDPKKYDPNRKTAAIESEGNRSIVVLTTADIDKIKKIAGIKSVEPYLNASVEYVAGQSGDKYTASVNTYIEGTNLTLLAGSLPSITTSRAETLLPETYLKALGYTDAKAAVGQTLKLGVTNALGKITETSATITGVDQKSLTGGGAFNINPALLKELRRLQSVGLPAAPVTFQAAVARFDNTQPEAAQKDLKDRLKKAGYDAKTVEDQIGTFKAVINGIIAVLNGFAVIALLAASFGIINTLLMSVQERTKEIGLMKAMGMGGGKIFLLFSFEAMMLGFWGSLIGSAAAIGAGQIANHIASTTILKDLEGLQLLAFTPASVAVIIGIVMAIAFLAGTLPAIRAARQSPIDSLRYE